MKKKPLMIIVTMLIALLVLPPVAHAGVVRFWWDNVYFVAGTDVDYAHPDNVYYGISPSSDWSRLGNNLYHDQINRDTSDAIRIGTAIFIDIVIMILTAKLGGSSTAYYVAGLAGIVISTVIDRAIDYYFVDERGCIWWWISWLFVYYLNKNLPYLSGINKEAALSEILAAFLCFGYFRVGMVTFHDPMGIGSPSYTLLSISATSGGTTNPSPGTYSYGYGSSVTVTATAYTHYVFDYWVLDGATISGGIIYSNPITLTMDSDYSLEAHFKWVNSPPNTPSTPFGPACECRWVSHGYSTSTTDPDGDLICYEFDWDDGARTDIGWYASGATSTAYYAWQFVGTYYVRVRAYDPDMAYSDWSPPLKVVISNGPLCAMKVWNFYVPNLTVNSLRFEFLFNAGIADQAGGSSPYASVKVWPDGKVEGKDVAWVGHAYGTVEGDPLWDYMADINGDRKVDGKDVALVSKWYGTYGWAYIYDLSGVTVLFNTGQSYTPIGGCVEIPSGATYFSVYKNGISIGAMITFW